MPPQDSDEEMECVEVLPDDVEEDDEEEEEDLAQPAVTVVATPEAADNDDDEEEEDDDDDDDNEEEEDSTEDDTDSEPETSSPAAAPPPKMRIKLKMPKIGGGKPSAAPSSSAASVASTTANSSRQASPSNADVVVSVGGSRPRPNLPLKRLSPPRVLMKKLPSNAGGNDTSSVGGNSTGGSKAISRIRSLKLPLSKKPTATDEESATADMIRTTTPGGGTYTKRRSMHPSKPVKLPPIVSPGLVANGSSSSSAQLFDQAMQAAGYTETSRTERPHRGSSIRRTVGDLFDSNVKLTMHFPSMVPPDMWSDESKEEGGAQPKDEDGDVVMGDGNNATGNKKQKFTADDLIEQLRDTIKSANGNHNMDISFDDMLPVSLTVPLPDSFIEERLQYVQAVEEREKAIVTKQEADQEAEFNGTDPPKITVPPIPVPPEPPRLESVNTSTTADKHPLYPPKQANLVKHLDPQMFHITEGRYFGLVSNNVADPNFCGPNALGMAAGNALAVASSSSTGTPLTLSSVLFSNHPLASATTAASSTGNEKASGTVSKGPRAPSSSGEVAASATADEEKDAVVATAQVVPSSSTMESSSKDVVVPATEVTSADETSPKNKGPEPTAPASALRKVMEEGGASAEEMRQAIIKCAVYASRTDGHGHSFAAPTGEIFPDIGKAFAAYAGIKPCERCKNNKQGSYHCRLRRKHKDVDYDGGTSWDVLTELQSKPLESLAPSVNVTVAEES
eukprot:scaffold521_cov167-Amphora_coffeaeformis.AAC.32